MNYTDIDSLPSRAELAQILLLFDKRIKSLEKKVRQIEIENSVPGSIVQLIPERAKKRYVYSKQDLLDIRVVVGNKISKLSTSLVGEYDAPRYADVLKTVSVSGGMTSARSDACHKVMNPSGFSFTVTDTASNNH